jgi:hypothetical protein
MAVGPYQLRLVWLSYCHARLREKEPVYNIWSGHPGNSGVVDEELDALRLLLLRIRCQPYRTRFGAYIFRQSMQASWPSVVEPHRLFQYLLSTAGDLQLGAVGHEGLSDH